MTEPTTLSLWETIPQDRKEKARKVRQQKHEARTVEATLSQMRALREELNGILYNQTDRPTVSSPADIAAFVQAEMEVLDHEELFVVLLNRRNAILKIVRLYVGSVNSSQVRISEIFRDAIIANASAIVPVHNHPSGDPTPSPDDVAMTRAVVQAGKLLDIDVLDHIVIGSRRYVSLKERGLGF